MSVIVDVLEAIATAVRAALPDEDVFVELDQALWRKHLPTKGRIVIVPGDESSEPNTNGTNAYTLPIDVIMQVPLGVNQVDPDQAVRDALDRREALQALYDEDGPLRDLIISGATWQGFRDRPLWKQTDLKSQHQFTSVLTPIYRYER